MKHIRVASARHRRRRLHRLALRPHPARRAYPGLADVARHRAGQADLRGQPGQPRPGPRPPRFAFVHGDICDAGAGRHDVLRRARRGRPLRRRVPRRPLHRRGRRVRAHQRRSAPRPCSTPACAAGIATFVHVSTDEVYGSIDEGSWPEDHPLEPNSPYSASKAGARPGRAAYHRTHGLRRARSPAAPTTTGPTSSPRRSSRCSSPTCSTAGRSRCTATARNVRDWLHVDDHCQGIETGADQGRARGGLQHRRRHRADQPPS